ncbi:MAG: hypothetical protein NTY00_04115 [Deltaproteobacteria bacterium]|nr:hypothetical protein [Deltaproteobacteria bacterium]
MRYSDDMAEACLYLLEQPEEKLQPLVNIGPGEDLTICELAELVRDVVGFGNLTFDPSKPGGTMRKLLDVSKLNQMDWKATTLLRESQGNTYKWYIDQATA